MTALEDAGFQNADDAMLVKAGLVPGFSSWQLAAEQQQVTQPGAPCRVISNACNSSIDLLGQHRVIGVDAASVPANMTPLGQYSRQRSLTAGTTDLTITATCTAGEDRDLLCVPPVDSSPGSAAGEVGLGSEGQEDSISSNSTGRGRLHWNPLYADTAPADAKCI
jgi:hypothetical protein